MVDSKTGPSAGYMMAEYPRTPAGERVNLTTTFTSRVACQYGEEVEPVTGMMRSARYGIDTFVRKMMVGVLLDF